MARSLVARSDFVVFFFYFINSTWYILLTYLPPSADFYLFHIWSVPPYLPFKWWWGFSTRSVSRFYRSCKAVWLEGEYTVGAAAGGGFLPKLFISLKQLGLGGATRRRSCCRWDFQPHSSTCFFDLAGQFRSREPWVPWEQHQPVGFFGLNHPSGLSIW